jgi:hypothetical protein
MKLTLQIDGETFEAEGYSFVSVIESLALAAGMMDENETIKILDPQQLQGANAV